jgi:hypothetical protein
VRFHVRFHSPSNPVPRFVSIGSTPAKALLVAILACCALPAAAAAQVIGHLPDASPYLDVDSPKELSIFGGYYNASKDLAGVAPTAGPAIGVRETIQLAGPAIALFRLSHAFTDRTVVDPLDASSQRDIATIHDPLTFLDAALGFNFTGPRSFHNLQFAINAGVGGASDLGAPKDAGGYRFGTVPVLVYGAGIRFVPPGRLSLRISADNYMIEHSYPKSYHTITGDGTSVVPTTHSLVDWRNNGMYTFGISYAIHPH